jgi:hypothetical protein
MNIPELEKLAKATLHDLPHKDQWVLQKAWLPATDHVEAQEFFASANPQTITQLIELIREMGKALENSVDAVQAAYDSDWRHGMPTREAQLECMRLELEQHKSALDRYKEMTK